MSTILVLSDRDGSRIAFQKYPVLFGRDVAADVMLTNVLASRRHCEITQTEEGLVVRDLGSVNGTMVNGKIIEEQILNAGDQLTIGARAFDVCSIGDSDHAAARRGVFSGVAEMLKRFGREQPADAPEMVTVASEDGSERFI